VCGGREPGGALVCDAVEVEILPEPSEGERRALLEALAADGAGEAAPRSRWREAALDDLRGDATTEDAWGDPRVVEP